MNDIREHPATYFLTACWIAVYVGMNVHQGQFLGGGGLDFGKISITTAHQFGDLTAREVAQGQVWRTVTATFVHFSLLHLVFNLTCLISFGRLLESWYGAPQFLAVYVAIGALGNSLAVIGRIAMNDGVTTPTAGGSSVMFGLIALIAVVGWRSKTRFGDYVRRQMVGKLLLFGVVMGVIGRGILDNYGHGGGAIAGAIVGFSHRLLLSWLERRFSRFLGGMALGVLGLCVVAQVQENRLEAKSGAPSQTLQILVQDYLDARTAIALYERLATHAEQNPEKLDERSLGGERLQLLSTLVRMKKVREAGAIADRSTGYPQWRALASAAALRFPTKAEVDEFRALSGPILSDAETRLTRAYPDIQIQTTPPRGQ